MKKIVGVELSHRYAPIAVREQLALNREQTLEILADLNKTYEEVFIICTCNRLSVYAFGESPKAILKYFDRFGSFRKYFSIFPDNEISVNNLFSTAAGLESQAIGEHQIVGQIRDALDLAREAGTIGPVLDELVRQAIHTGKKVRLETKIGKHSASLATVGFELINKYGYKLPETSILVIGTGNMANLVATILDRSSVEELFIASHDMERAGKMADNWGGKALEIGDVYKIIKDVDIVIGGTQGEVNILREKEIADSKCTRAQFAFDVKRPKLLIDFGVPRNFNPELKNHEAVELFDLDDIKKLTFEGILKRYDEIPEARKIIQNKTQDFIAWFNHRKVAPLIEEYWSNLENIKEKELKWLLPKMGDLSERQEELLQRFAHRLIRKMSKKPFKNIKNFAQNIHEVDNRINTTKKLLNLNDVDIIVPKRKIIIGSRGSKLALTQTGMVVDALKKAEPEYEFIIEVVRTKGDDGDISVLGAFTTAIQRELAKGKVDIAVHSYKDMPTETVNGLKFAALFKRHDCRDVLISKKGEKLKDLSKGAIVGTGSLRREIQLKRLRPDINVKFIQGNIDSRMKKMEEGDYDAIVLAAAGLERMDMMDLATEIFDTQTMLPAVAQGILAAEIKDQPGYLNDLVEKIDHKETRIAAEAERTFLKALGGGCNMPMAAYATVFEDKFKMDGMYATEDGTYYARDVITGDSGEHIKLARKLAEQLKVKVESEVAKTES